MTVTKQDLAKIVADGTKILNKKLENFECIKFIDDFFESIIAGLENGHDVKITSFGTFILHDKKERIGRNPKTLEEFKIKKRRVANFKSNTSLRLLVRDNLNEEQN